MMHGFGFPLFMGGPLVWVLILIGGYFLIRKVLLPYLRSPRKYNGNSSSLYSSRNESTETAIYRLASKRNGEITVSDVVTEIGVESRKAEKLLESMSDGQRVRMEVDENGAIYYTFPELQR